MDIEVLEDSKTTLAEYATIPISFQVNSVLDVLDRSAGQPELLLIERNLEVPYIKDYNTIAGEHPTQWPARFDLSNWKFLAAHVAGQRIGGAAVAFNTTGLEMLNGRSDIAALWDIRVAPDARGQGIGSALFNSAESWARARGCRELIVETQNINVPACRFYQRQGCVLVAVNRPAYPAYPNEIQLIWQKTL
jgi:GNAT superfamily N-acetyltransferase